MILHVLKSPTEGYVTGLGLQFLVSAVWRSVEGRESQHLQCIEGIQWRPNILLCISQPCALTVDRE